MLKGLIIFGGGMYAGVYLAQNYQDAVNVVFKNGTMECDKTLDDVGGMIEKVEDPMTLISKAQKAIQSALDESGPKKK